jgi:iron-sulfur cluster assembly protein
MRYEMNSDTIHVTPDALSSITTLQGEMDAAGFGLRFGFTTGGCSGNRYVIEFESEPDEDDLIFEYADGVAVYVKESQMVKLKNSTIGWADSLMESGFQIDNPQAKRACGCGESIDF